MNDKIDPLRYHANVVRKHSQCERRRMELLYFYLTVIVQLISVIAAAACLSVYLVSHRRTFLFAFCSFLFYFIDVSLIFQDEFVGMATSLDSNPLYLTIRSLGSMVSGGGIFVSLWLLVCDFVGEKRVVLLAAPGVVFVAGSLAALFLIPESSLARFVFYSMRTLLLLWTIAFIVFRYVTTLDATERGRMRRHKLIFIAFVIGGICILLEDVGSFFYGVTPFPATHFDGERNYSEELLMLICAGAACVSAYRALSLRYENPPTREDEHVESAIEGNLELYAKRHKLSKREMEALKLILLGLDNQNIASTMGVAPSTAKVHVHNILQKTGHPNRQDLIQDFWRTW